MNRSDLFQLLEKYTNKNADMKLFIIELTEYYAKKYNVPNCKIEFISFDDIVGHKTHTAFFKQSENTIYFRKEVPECGDIFRIIKLTSHEWMHYYVSLFEKGITKQKDLIKEYKDLIIETKFDVSFDLTILLQKYSKAYTKLSAYESVADNFAQNVLKDLQNEIKDINLLKCIDNQISGHNKQVKELQGIINNNPELNAIVEKLKKKNKKRN